MLDRTVLSRIIIVFVVSLVHGFFFWFIHWGVSVQFGSKYHICGLWVWTGQLNCNHRTRQAVLGPDVCLFVFLWHENIWHAHISATETLCAVFCCCSSTWRTQEGRSGSRRRIQTDTSITGPDYKSSWGAAQWFMKQLVLTDSKTERH